MNLADTIRLYAGSVSDFIGDTVNTVFNKKRGKRWGIETIGDKIRQTATKAAKKSFGLEDLPDDVLKDIDDFVAVRQKYIKKSFAKLNNPQTDKSQRRIDLIGDTEERAAQEFGRAKGYEGTGRKIKKVWVAGDSCEICLDNEDEGPIDVDEVFPSGDYAPPAHPNCDCGLDYEEDDEEDDDAD